MNNGIMETDWQIDLQMKGVIFRLKLKKKWNWYVWERENVLVQGLIYGRGLVTSLGWVIVVVQHRIPHCHNLSFHPVYKWALANC